MISLNWVKDYVDIENEDLNELAVKITKAGVNVEKVISNNINNLIIGEVIECKNHPDSDHLHVCKVNIGKEILQIVCGAPNVKTGIKVIVAQVGAVLPGNFEIKKSVIRGVESNGMLSALFELGLAPSTKENYDKGIEILPDDAPIGKNPLELLGYDDTIYELDVHKHRNNDCYYHIGFAYEIGTILDKKVKLPIANYNEIEDSINDHFNLTVTTEKCPYYLAKLVQSVTIKESPDFIKKRLTSVGMRPINNVVDISNYVMLEYGQPMHFFDYDKLGNNILVRNAKENEEIITLDDKKRALLEQDLVITNGDEPVAIAGIMGGENTDIDLNTKNILIESAIFDPISIRNTAARLDLKSEASIRYGKGLNYEYTAMAIDRACSLLEEYADAKILSGIVIHDNLKQIEKVVTIDAEDINKLLGITITNENICKELKRLDFKYTQYNNKFTVTIPNRRLDIDPNVNDIAEEIGRLYGYHNLVSTLPKCSTRKGVYVGDVLIRKETSKRLRTLGLNECKTYTLTSPTMAKQFKYEGKTNLILPNPMSVDKSVIRTTILPSLLSTYEYNKARNVENVLLYEISKTYDNEYNEDTKVAILIKGNYLVNEWQGTTVKCDFFVLKGILENLLNYLGYKNKYSYEQTAIVDLHPGISAKIMLGNEQLGIIGKVHPSIIKDDVFVLEMFLTKLYNTATKKLKYKAVSKYPEIKKDVAFILDNNISCEEIIKEIKKQGTSLLTTVSVFDLYHGENIDSNKKSLAFSLTFNSNERTLTEEEIDKLFKNIIETITKKFGAILRDK